MDTIRTLDEPPPPLVISSMERLNQLIEKAEPILQAGMPAETSELFQSLQPSTVEDSPPLIK